MPIEFFNHMYGEVTDRRPIPKTTWKHFDLFWVHTGRMTMHFEPGGAWRMEAGQGVLIYPQTAFSSGVVESNCRASVQHFQVKAGADLPKSLHTLVSFRRGFEPLVAAVPKAVDAMIASAMRLAQRSSESPVPDMRVAQLTLLLGELKLAKQAPPADRDDRLQALLEELNDNPATYMTLAAMAQRVSLSESHFRAVFKARHGESPARYRQYLRMREAARLLRETDRPIKQIAQQLGFTQVPHFYRQFQSFQCVTPARYRRECLRWA